MVVRKWAGDVEMLMNKGVFLNLAVGTHFRRLTDGRRTLEILSEVGKKHIVNDNYMEKKKYIQGFIVEI